MQQRLLLLGVNGAVERPRPSEFLVVSFFFFFGVSIVVGVGVFV